jgi:ubiquinone/menaquinone biosynthesis C-methylase UbiE
MSELKVHQDLPRPLFSRFYAKISPGMEDEGMADLRQELLAPLTGTVVEIGAGNGLNFGHYPATVTRVVAVEPEPRLRELAVAAAAAAPIPVEVTAGTAGNLPLPDGSVDGAVFCLVLCSIPDRHAALAEVVRVLRPGGTLRFLEHTLADTPARRRIQRLVDATVWPLLTGGCHTATDPARDIERAGLQLTSVRQLRFPFRGPRMPASPHALGSASAPDLGQP